MADVIKLKFGALLTRRPATSLVSDAVLAKVFKCSPTHLRNQYMTYFHKIELKDKSLLEQMQHARDLADRKNGATATSGSTRSTGLLVAQP